MSLERLKYKPLRVGLTGGIGSGKTIVAKVFNALGVPVFYADKAAKQCMQEDEALKQKLQTTFGTAIYKEGVLQRTALAQIIFNNEAALQQVNALVHPAVQQRFEQWCLEQNTPYVLKEAAILFESGSDKGLDAVVCVSAPEALRIQRVVQRDGVQEEQVQARINKQWPQDKKIAQSDYHICNDDKSLLMPQILKVHQAILERVG